MGHAGHLGAADRARRGHMRRTIAVLAVACVVACAAGGGAAAKDKVKVGFIGPLTGGVAANGIGGRNSAELAVKLRNAGAHAKYEYEPVGLDHQCKPNVGLEVATKVGAA